MTRDFICIICPKGCRLKAEIEGEQVTVSGNACPRGAAYAVSEALHPMRTVTATVRVANRKDTMVSVKTETPVPKEKMMDVMAFLRDITVNAPITIGQIFGENICGANIIATKNID